MRVYGQLLYAKGIKKTIEDNFDSFGNNDSPVNVTFHISYCVYKTSEMML